MQCPLKKIVVKFEMLYNLILLAVGLNSGKVTDRFVFLEQSYFWTLLANHYIKTRI